MKLNRPRGCLGLLIAVAGLIALLAWVVVRFSTPRPALVMVGEMQEFSQGQAPRLIDQDGTLFYVLRSNSKLVALYARAPRHTHCLVRWDEHRRLFIDPCLGTRFFPTGEYQGGGPPQELIKLPFQVKNGQVWVETNLEQK